MTRSFDSTRRLGLCSAAALMLAAPPALADSVFERFVNFHYIVSEIDSGAFANGSADSDIAAGFQITNSFWDYGRLIGEVDVRKYDGDSSATEDPGRAELDVQSASVGIGAGTVLLDRFNVLLAVSYDDFRVRLEDDEQMAPANTVGPFVNTDSSDGVGLQLGVGAEVIEGVELFARYKTIKFDVDQGEEDTETLARVGVRWAALERLNLLVEYETFDELEISDIRIGFGLTFGD